MNPLAYGYDAWTFLHHIPYLFPNEILDDSEVCKLQRGVFFLLLMNPCPVCRFDSIQLWQRRKAECKINAPSPEGYKPLVTGGEQGEVLYTRTSFARCLSAVHDDVNAKLHRPAHGFHPQETPDWALAMCNYILACCFNFPEDLNWEVSHVYDCWLGDVLPSLLETTMEGMVYKAYLDQNPLPFSKVCCLLSGTEEPTKLPVQPHLTKWSYELSRELLPRMWDAEDVALYFQIMRARKTDCSEAPSIGGGGTEHHHKEGGCQ